MMTQIHTFAEKMMNTINGKLILVNSSELDEVKQRIEQIDRKFELIETQTANNGDRDMNESLQQLNSIGLSVHQIRQISSRFLWIAVAASVGLTLVNILGTRHSSCSARASENALYRDVNSMAFGVTR
jgi:uncharacterized protein YlzI (FlbEa/FlbD family)